MSSEDYRTTDERTESTDTYKSSEEALQRSESDQQDQLFAVSEIEREIEDEHYDDFKTYVEILVEIGQKELKPLKFTDCFTSDRPGMYLEILPKIIFETVETETGIEEIDFPKPIFRLTINQGTFASVEHTSSSAQTLRSKLVNSWCQYEPRLSSEEDCLATVNSEPFNAFFKKAEERIFDALIHNQTADSFLRELETLCGESDGAEASKVLTLSLKGSFVCFEGDQKQIINSVSWHPVVKDIFIASTLCNKKFEERTFDSIENENDSFAFYIWSCNNQYMPKIFLEYFDEIMLHRFNPTMPNIVVGGSLCGQLILWNLEEIVLKETSKDKDSSYYEELNSTPAILRHVAVSNPDHSHTRGIKDCVWLPSHMEVISRGNIKLKLSKEVYQIATYGSDGILKFWDLRTGYHHKSGISVAKMSRQLDGKWEPVHSVEVQLEIEKQSFSVTKFGFRESMQTVKYDQELSEEDRLAVEKKISTEFYAGCDDGKIFCGDFRLFRDEAGSFKAHPPKMFTSPHSGSITAIALSPFVSDIFLSTGSRTVCIWKHDIKETPIFSRDMHTYITSADWSNTRPAVFILGYEDGSIEVWDLLENIYEASLIHIVTTTSITAISTQTVTEEEHVVAAGDSHGIVYILTLPTHLWMPVDNELMLMDDFIEKEADRKKTSFEIFESTTKASEDVKAVAEEKIDTIMETPTDEELKKLYEEFLELEQVQLRYLGIANDQKDSISSEDILVN